VPRASEIVQIDFNPVAGHEQANLRPAVVLSNQGYNDKTSLIVCVACTSKIKGNPFEVAIAGLAKPTVALSDQLRMMDWRGRKAFSLGFATPAEVTELREKLRALLGM
jgi:mRNA interferase MazF